MPPLGIQIAVRLAPPVVRAEHRAAAAAAAARPLGRAGAAFVVAPWIAAAEGLLGLTSPHLAG